uniref:Uncharacterized protein n=1 Tax=Globodera rostochiensis TaxID=31243 RepID=A0A914H0G7_GLORO
MSYPYQTVYTWPPFNDRANQAYLYGNIQMLPAVSQNTQLFDYSPSVGQHTRNFHTEWQRYVAQLEQDKRSILERNVQLEAENAALKAEISQLEGKNNEMTSRDNSGWPTNCFSAGPNFAERGERSNESQRPSEQQMHVISKECELLLPQGIDVGGTVNDQLAIGICRNSPQLIANLANQPDDDDHIRHIVSILEKHSPRKKRLESLSLVAKSLGEDSGGGDGEEGAIECIGIVKMATSLFTAADTAFPPPPITPPPPTERPLIATKMFTTTTVAAAAATTTDENAYEQRLPNNPSDDSEEIVFVDDICRSKWLPSMTKREPPTEGEEIVLGNEGEEEEAIAVRSQAAEVHPVEPQKLKKEPGLI